MSYQFFIYTGLEIVVATNIQSVEALAVDWIGSNLYYTDSLKGVLGVVALNSSRFQTRRELLRELGNPRGLAVNPHVG